MLYLTSAIILIYNGVLAMRTVLNILNFTMGGFCTTFAWLLTTLVTIVLLFTLPLTRSCWEITKLSLFPYGNVVIHVEKLKPGRNNRLISYGGTLINILWFVFFGWWLCLSHIMVGFVQCLSIIGIPTGIANFKIAIVALWPVGRRIVPIEVAGSIRECQ